LTDDRVALRNRAGFFRDRLGQRAHAQANGVEVVDLDLTRPFTAARARNEGVARLQQIAPQTAFVQFVDGDCEVVGTWFADALDAFAQNDQLAVVCGRRKERFPETSIYNFMCDLEWDTPIGPAKACGGDALMRLEAFSAVNGYNATLIAGEEPEMCLRMRAQGWQIERIDSLMTMHDAAIVKLSQWWKRSVRAGHAYAEGAYLHGQTEERHWVKETIRAWVWALLIPLVILILFSIGSFYGVLALLLYPLQLIKESLKKTEHGLSYAVKLAFYSILGKFAEMKGQLEFVFGLLLNNKSKIIEYK